MISTPLLFYSQHASSCTDARTKFKLRTVKPSKRRSTTAGAAVVRHRPRPYSSSSIEKNIGQPSAYSKQLSGSMRAAAPRSRARTYLRRRKPHPRHPHLATHSATELRPPRLKHSTLTGHSQTGLSRRREHGAHEPLRAPFLRTPAHRPRSRPHSTGLTSPGLEVLRVLQSSPHRGTS